MSKYNSRYQSTSQSEDKWFAEFENNLNKSAVQPRNQDSIYDQINSIINNTKSKYTSVEHAVQDMRERSGLATYKKASFGDQEESETGEEVIIEEKTNHTNELNMLADKCDEAISKENYHAFGYFVAKADKLEHKVKKNAVEALKALKSDPYLMEKEVLVPTSHWAAFTLGYASGLGLNINDKQKYINYTNSVLESVKKKSKNDVNNVIDKKINVPVIFTKAPQIKSTLENYITSTNGNLAVPAIINKIKAIHDKDVAESKLWDDDDFIRFVSDMNIKTKSLNVDNKGNDESRLGLLEFNDIDTSDSSNSDAFNALNTAKF